MKKKYILQNHTIQDRDNNIIASYDEKNNKTTCKKGFSQQKIAKLFQGKDPGSSKRLAQGGCKAVCFGPDPHPSISGRSRKSWGSLGDPQLFSQSARGERTRVRPINRPLVAPLATRGRTWWHRRRHFVEGSAAGM